MIYSFRGRLESSSSIVAFSTSLVSIASNNNSSVFDAFACFFTDLSRMEKNDCTEKRQDVFDAQIKYFFQFSRDDWRSLSALLRRCLRMDQDRPASDRGGEGVATSRSLHPGSCSILAERVIRDEEESNL